MKNTIKCPHCGKEFEATEALKHEIEEQVSQTLLSKHKEELEEVKRKSEEETKERVEKLTNQISELLDEIKKLREKDEEREIQMKKRLMDEEERIKVEVRQKADEEHKLKDLEKDNKLQQALDQIESLKTKIQQGSQQTQGETLELELETKLREEFPTDKILEVKKGQRGADVEQEVVDKLGRSCGKILWESKNAEWSNGWISKLKEDQRQAKADLAVLVTVNLPEGVDSFAYRDGVWIVSWKHFIPLSWSLRFNLVSLFHERTSSEGKDEKMKILYQYLTGTEFKNRVEGIVDAFSNLQEELEKEKRYFNVKWARQEKEIRKVIDHTHGMYGDLQGVIGKSLPEIKSLELHE
ncbi:MAG: hypothetical protein UT17_C0004G0056 [Candidatus Woesebacteria bacterium GW2011_GWB1_39_10]|uniref:DUF2130 domain-containing protein n=2 Tax=Candidatus Woeseibacteriota TaxID=1752722 RepID=A0A0G0LIK9_9BACT|nr:MAG: hypothetical protein UT17_C0004G0056 [Candidatus Woesebacteria bacterium GW2011_GWB1_39_10]KKS90700.1 MAG: hypothetical protein UV66_C0001G0057 [Candidatus Woesebacteria bacterium GW2011_GWA1_43_12]